MCTVLLQIHYTLVQPDVLYYLVCLGERQRAVTKRGDDLSQVRSAVLLLLMTAVPVFLEFEFCS